MMEILDLFLNFECIFICSLTVKTENKLQLRLQDYITNLLLMYLYTSTYVLLLSACTMKRFQTLMNVVKIMETKDQTSIFVVGGVIYQNLLVFGQIFTLFFMRRVSQLQKVNKLLDLHFFTYDMCDDFNMNKQVQSTLRHVCQLVCYA